MAKRRRKKRLNPVYLLMALILVLLLVILLFLLVPMLKREKKEEAPLPTLTAAPETPRPTRKPLDVDLDYTAVHNMEVTVYFHETDEVKTLPLEEYMVGVTAGEVPASYSFEAIKAQAVAARSYTLYTIRHGGCASHEGVDICTDSSCCQSFKPDAEMREQWYDYGYYLSVVKKAVKETNGEVMLYHGKPVDAMYHASSGGCTEDSEHVYKNAVKYLRGVESPYEEDRYQNVTVTFTYKEAFDKLNALYPEAKLSEENLKDQIRVLSTYPSGRVEKLQIGSAEVAGTKFRKSMGLFSTMLTLEFTDKELIIHTKGYGHGVGMSQSGAYGMAKQGFDYHEILSHYYTGVTFGIIGQY